MISKIGAFLLGRYLSKMLLTDREKNTRHSTHKIVSLRSEFKIVIPTFRAISYLYLLNGLCRCSTTDD